MAKSAMKTCCIDGRRPEQNDNDRTGLVSLSSVLLSLLLSINIITGVHAGSSSSPTIPRSTNARHSFSDPDPSPSAGAVPLSSPPWNPSTHIDDDGFLTSHYTLLPGEWEVEANIGGRHGPTSKRYKSLHRVPVRIRQVPGDGNCLFHSIATCLSYAANGTHVCMRDTSALYSVSKMLRTAAVDCLSCNPQRRLFLQGSEYLRAGELVSAAAAQYDLSGEEYCEQMRRDSYWGGGPEIVALCNVLRRPIHVYELCTDAHPDIDEEGVAAGVNGGGGNDKQLRGSTNNEVSSPLLTTSSQFRLRRMACFGSPRFDRREPLHILSADSRFPDVQPGRQLGTGNHFLALFPDPLGEVASFVRKPRRVRGGGGGGRGENEGVSKSVRRRKQDADSAEARYGGKKSKRKSSGGRSSPTSVVDLDLDDDDASLWERCASRMSRILEWDV